MFSKSVIWSLFIYGLILILLGIYGYTQSNSLISLISGAGFGSLILVSGFILMAKKTKGIYFAILLTALLTVVFAFRYAASMKDLPAILAVLSAGMFIFLVVKVKAK